MKTLLFFAMILLFSSCTMHFKATDVEADVEANATYELESIDLFAISE